MRRFMRSFDIASEALQYLYPGGGGKFIDGISGGVKQKVNMLHSLIGFNGYSKGHSASF